jgi:hypothetical protein
MILILIIIAGRKRRHVAETSHGGEMGSAAETSHAVEKSHGGEKGSAAENRHGPRRSCP